MNSLRPDERASQAEIERDKKFRSNLKSGIMSAATSGGAVLQSGILSRVAPLLSEYIPEDIAMKGISKISPKLGEFLDKGKEMGLDLKEGFQFIKDKLPQENAKETKNIIEQYSPDLHQFITQEIQKGLSPIEAGALAQNDRKFSRIVHQISKDHKSNWSAILESIYGGGQIAQAKAPGNEQVDQQQLPGQTQSGNVDQALMIAFDKIMKM